MLRSLFLVLPLMILLLLSASPAAAQTRVFIPCPNGPPCDTKIAGHIDAIGTARLPWVATVAAPANVCLFVERVSSDGAVIVSVIAPNGIVYRDDTAVEVTPTIAGWYTIQLDTPPPGREQIFQFVFEFHAAGICTSTPGR